MKISKGKKKRRWKFRVQENTKDSFEIVKEKSEVLS